MNICVAFNKDEIIHKTYLIGTYLLEIPMYGIQLTEKE
jgi:hypothetical protein